MPHRNQLLRVLTITFYSELRFWWSYTLWKSLWNSLQDYAKVHLIWISFERRLNRCLSEGPVQVHRKNRCYWFLHNSSSSAFLWVLSSCFALYGLFTPSLGSRNVHLTKPLVPLIVLLFDHQNHSKWHKWCHVRYKVTIHKCFLDNLSFYNNFVAPILNA